MHTWASHQQSRPWSPCLQATPRTMLGRLTSFGRGHLRDWSVLCQAVANDPVQATCCGKIYCVQCIGRWHTRAISCPTCRSTFQSRPPFNVFRDRNALQRITSLVVYCPNWKDGCNKRMELSEVEKHVTSVNCFMFQRVECEYKRFGCAVVLPRKDMEGHLQTSVEDHLRLTKIRVEEQETALARLVERLKCLESNNTYWQY